MMRLTSTAPLVLAAVVITFFFQMSSAIDCDVTSEVLTAQTACDVSDLSHLTVADNIANLGSPKFCSASCRNAINALMRAYGHNCPMTAERIIHQRIQKEQYECDSPEAECEDVYAEYLFWVQTEEGFACSRQFTSVKNTVGSTNPAQNQLDEFCQGACGTQVNAFLTRMRASGCGSWRAFLSLQREMSMICSQHNDKYCWPGYLESLTHEDDARNSSLPVSQRNAVLESVCKNCFREVVRTNAAFKAALGTEDNLGELCIQDGNSYCLPEYESAVATVDSALSVSTPQDQEVNLKGRTFCTADNQRCAQKMWAYLIAKPTTSDSLRDELINFLENLCMESSADGSGDLCAEVMRDVVSGTYTESEVSSVCNPTDVNGECTEPPQCQLWASRDVCPFGCSNAISEIIDELGCCFNGVKQLHRDVSSDLDATLELFERIEFLSAECCAKSGSACPSGVPDPCTVNSFEALLSVNVPSVPASWIKHNEQAFNASVISDIALNLGTAESSIVLLSANEQEDGSVLVTFAVKTQTQQQANTLQSDWDDAVDTGLILQHTAATYMSRCTPGANDNCNGSGAAAVSAGLLLVLLLVSVLSS